MSREVGKDKKVWSVRRRGACGGRADETKGAKVIEGGTCEGVGEDEQWK